MHLEEKVHNFLKRSKKWKNPLLLGFSGGEDSLALAHCLKRLEVPFHLAHFDHAWREKSKWEAEELKKWAEREGIVFHTDRSSSGERGELAAREERYLFFENLFVKGGFQALVLAHHREDQVETVLKRIFEGANLTTLKGIRPTHYMGEMPVWRPLLEVPKKVISSYLKEHSLTPIDDPTNRDPKYLRARMRGELIPFLSEKFGKEIAPSVARIGRYSLELEDYLRKKTESLYPLEGPFGLMWDFSSSHPAEIRYVLGSFFRRKSLTISQLVVDRILEAVDTKAANRKLFFSSQTVIVDRGHLFWLKKDLPSFPKIAPLQEGLVKEGDWEWTIRFVDAGSLSSWKDWWRGKISFAVQEGQQTLDIPGRSSRKWQNSHRIPAFLRDAFPMTEQKKSKEAVTASRFITVEINTRP